MHPTRRAFGRLLDIAPSLDDLRQIPGARPSESAFLREAPAPGPSRPHLDVGLDAAVGAVIRTARLRIGMTQVDLSRALDISNQAVRDWESGREPVPPGRVSQLARALGLVPQDIAAPAHIARDAEERALLVAFRALPAAARAELLGRLS